MATLIPSLGSCVSRMTPSEHWLAERLEQKLDASHLLWYGVPVGPKQSQPSFAALHPRLGLLILETRDWKPETIQQASRQAWDIVVDGRVKVVMSPFAQARFCALQAVNALERDPQLVQADGPSQGKLAFPWGYGVAFTHMTRQQFEAAGLGEAIELRHVICQDEMQPATSQEEFQRRLWNMRSPLSGGGSLSLGLLDRVRWSLFALLRLPVPGVPFDDGNAQAVFPDRLRVMDLPQELLVRSLGDGHRVIHGVAGSGKTMLLIHRAETLAKASVPESKPILILCYNEPLALKLAAVIQIKGLGSQVQVAHFYKWCSDQLIAFGQKLPAPNLPVSARMDDMVQRVIRAVDSQTIPSGQYQALLIDEGHDFAPGWLKLVTRMVDPATNSLLLLYDDAQSIHERSRSLQFSFKRVGIQAQGRTTILQINHRNTRQVLQTASLIAGSLLMADEQDEDGIPLIQPVSCGRDGPPVIITRLQTFREEAFKMAELLSAAHQDGHAWGEMAIICRHTWMRDECVNVLQLRKLPYETRTVAAVSTATDSIKLLTMQACKGLEFAVVALPGVGHMPGTEDNPEEEARLFYIAATRATERLFITVSRTGAFGRQLAADR